MKDIDPDVFLCFMKLFLRNFRKFSENNDFVRNQNVKQQNLQQKKMELSLRNRNQKKKKKQMIRK